MADFMVVDADSHIQENREALLKHVDGPARRRFAMEDRPWVYFPRNSWDFSLGGHFGRLDTGASEYLRLLDQAGVEQVVLYPSMGLSAGFVQEPELAVALCRAYNRCGSSPASSSGERWSGFRGFASRAWRRPSGRLCARTPSASTA